MENILNTVDYTSPLRYPGYRYRACHPLLLTGNISLIAALTAPGSPLALFFTGLQNLVVHVNADIRPGRLDALFMGPAHDRLHHSVIVSEVPDFGTSITLQDRLFATYVSAVKTPQHVGIAQPIVSRSSRACPLAAVPVQWRASRKITCGHPCHSFVIPAQLGMKSGKSRVNQKQAGPVPRD